MKLTYEQFLDLSRTPPQSATPEQIEKLKARIGAASDPAGQRKITSMGGTPSGPPNFRLDIEGVPSKNGRQGEQLSVMFRKSGPSSVQMRAYQGNTFSEKQDAAVLDVTLNKSSGQKSSHLEWVGKRKQDTPCDLTGNQLMASFKGLMTGSGYPSCDLSDVSGLRIDPKQPEGVGEVKLRVTSAYEKGKTWYMGHGAQPQGSAEAWNQSAQQLSRLKVSDAIHDLGGQVKQPVTGKPGASADELDSSGMQLQQIVDTFAPRIAAASGGKYPNAQAVKDNMGLAEFYREMVKPEVLGHPDLAQSAGKNNTSPVRMAHDFYSVAMERNVANDPNPAMAEAAKRIRDTGDFVFHF